MDMATAKKMVGQTVNSDCGIFGILEAVKPDGWAVVRGPRNRRDEIQVGRIFLSPT